MFEVSFWRNGIEKTIAERFDTLTDAREWASEGLRYKDIMRRYAYDEAAIYDTEDKEFAEYVTR